MAALTDEQTARAGAWAKVFEDGPATTVVLDDMTVFVDTLPETQQAGGAKLLLYILRQRSRLRRAARRNGKGALRG